MATIDIGRHGGQTETLVAMAAGDIGRHGGRRHWSSWRSESLRCPDVTDKEVIAMAARLDD